MSAATELIWCFLIAGAMTGLICLWERWQNRGQR